MNSDAETGMPPGDATPGREEALRRAVESLLSRNDPNDPRVRMLAQVTVQVLMAEIGDAD